jgi:hypothetical protein
MGTPSPGTPHTQAHPQTFSLRPRLLRADRRPRPPLATNNQTSASSVEPQLATTQCKNTKTNPPSTLAFPQKSVNIGLKKTPLVATLPNQGEKAGSRQDQPTQNPDRNRIQPRPILSVHCPLPTILRPLPTAYCPLPTIPRGSVRRRIQGRFPSLDISPNSSHKRELYRNCPRSK